MATYNENSLKIKKSDLIIYIIALVAFILMIVVLMSDRIGVNKNVNSLITTDNVNNNFKKNTMVTKKDDANTSVMPNGKNQLAEKNKENSVNRELVRDLQSDKKQNVTIEKQDKLKTQNTTKITATDNSSKKEVVKLEAKNKPKTEIKPDVNERNKTQAAGNKLSVAKPKKIARTRSVSRAKITYAKPVRVVPRRRINSEPDTGLRVVRKIHARSGDALWRIALRNRVRTINIIYVNKLKNPDLIYPGQVINIPNK